MQWYSSILEGCSSDVRSSSKPSKPLNSGSKRPPPSEIFSLGHDWCQACIHPPRPVPLTFFSSRIKKSNRLRTWYIYRYCKHVVSPQHFNLSQEGSRLRRSHLVEANVLRLLAEALTAQIEVVLADKTGGVLADAAVIQELANRSSCPSEYRGAVFRPRCADSITIGRVTRRRKSDPTWVNRTSCESPCRSFAGASSRRFRET